MLRSKVATARDGRTALEDLIQQARELPPPGLDLPQDVKLPAALAFSDASSRLVFTAIARLANMSIGFDPSFRDAPVTVDLRNASLADALNAVADQTRTFFRVTGSRSILVIPDTPAKRGEYYAEMQKLILDDAINVFLGYPSRAIGAIKSVQGLVLSPIGNIVLRDVDVA